MKYQWSKHSTRAALNFLEERKMKKILFALLAVVVLASSLVVSTSAAEIPTDGLIANFHFDMTWDNSVEGAPAGEPISTQFGEALYTDVMDPDRYWFTGVEGQAFLCTDGDGLNTLVNPGDSDFTLGLWILEVAHTGITPYVWYGQHTQSPESWIGIWNVDIAQGWAQNGITIGSNNEAGSRPEIVPTEEAALYDAESGVELQWTHVAYTAVLDAETNTYTVTAYINGVNAGSNTGFPNPNTGDPETNGDYIYINGINAWGDAMSTGAMDELVVYNRALTDDEMAALYAAYPTPATYDSADAFMAAQIMREEEGDDTAAPETNKPADETQKPADNTTAAPAEEGGCGSAMGAVAAIVALVSILGCAIVKKH